MSKTERFIYVDGNLYFEANSVTERAYDVATMASAAAIMASVNAIADFIKQHIIEDQDLDIPRLLAFLKERGKDEEGAMEMGREAVSEILEQLSAALFSQEDI